MAAKNFDLVDFAMKFGIALLLVFIIAAGTALPTAKNALNDLQTKATAQNYTATANIIPTVQSFIDISFLLILLGLTLEPVLILARKKAGQPGSYTTKAIAYSIGLLLYAIFVFQIGLPTGIDSGVADNTLATVTLLSAIPILVAGIGGIYSAVKGVAKTRSRSQPSVVYV